MNNEDFVFGFHEEQNAFTERHQDFLVELEQLWPVAEEIFNRPLPHGSYRNVVVYVLGRMALDSFGGILVLATNGYGIEANKLLRTMYEETVTMAYLAKHPNDADSFVEYLKFEKGKLAKVIETLAPGFFKNEPQMELRQKIESEYEEVADGFLSKPCPACKQRRMPSWTELTIEAMAKKAGHNLSHIYLPSYVNATKKTHVAPISVASYVQEDEQGLSFKLPPMRAYADQATMLAHWLLITVLEVQNETFSLSLDETLAKHDERLSMWSNARDWKMSGEYSE